MANTGNVIVTERDINPFSPTYDTTRTSTYADYARCFPSTLNFKAVTFASDNTSTVIECGHLSTTTLMRKEVNDRDCVYAVIGDCTTKTGAQNYPYESSGLVGTFESCANLESVYISDTVTEVGENTFRNCENLTDVHFGSTVAQIGVEAFYNCSSLTDIVIPDTVSVISDNAFNACTGLTNVTLSNSIEKIGARSFYYCESLLTITIPASIEYIYSYAFQYCRNLTSITILATTPPLLPNDRHPFDDTNDCPILVPSESLNDYKTASGWSDYESRIEAIPT